MDKKLFLLDGMALVYRAHFALINRPIFSSKGVNTSALYGFTQTLLDIIKTQKPTHLGLVFDTEKPTQRHIDFPAYKSQREEMPEDLCKAIPHVCRMAEAFRIPVITCDGWEADDVIGTMVKVAEKEGFVSYMVTPDKDFGQLVSDKTFLYKPSRMGDGIEILDLPRILEKWGVQKAEQVIDILGLWGDVSDNIPGVPGIGEKTASKLITQYGSIENLLQHTSELKGKLKESLETNREQALLSKKLATILCDAPCLVDLEKLKLQEPDTESLSKLLIEFEFNALGKRLLGENFKAGRGAEAVVEKAPASATSETEIETTPSDELTPPIVRTNLKTIADVQVNYVLVDSKEKLQEMLGQLLKSPLVAFSVETSEPDPRHGNVIGVSFSVKPFHAWYLHLPSGNEKAEWLALLSPILSNENIEKCGHDLKFDLSALKWQGIETKGILFDTMIAHSLIEPEVRHSLEYVSESLLGYTPIPINNPVKEQPAELDLSGNHLHQLVNQACEFCDVSLRIREAIVPLLKARGQETVFYKIESPLVRVLVEMEVEGIRLDPGTLKEFAIQLGDQMGLQEKRLYQLAGKTFNVNSPRQLGDVLFQNLKLLEKPKKTKTGQFATDEQTLQALSAEHEIVRVLLDYRGASKLKSTYVDALPEAIWSRTGRIHTTYFQAATSTGRLNSQNPNLQNIPIRTDQGKEIRKAFVPRGDGYSLLAADYSQIELRILASISGEKAMMEAFEKGMDIHTATAARVYGVFPDMVSSEMRRNAKMVNFGISYGISAFGLSQRLGIPRKEAAGIIDQYFAQFPGIRQYMTSTIEFATRHGYVETLSGRRRYMRDINSSNTTVRSGVERNAINAPIQGSAADMIKIAMSRIQESLATKKFKTKMLLQVHDELVFDLWNPEEEEVVELVKEIMRNALPLKVPIIVETGVGKNWLEAH
ncbi:MAG: polA [Verrucomicrobiales bacterium]|nr:polA [Verrucomicrobiales bacterium]